MIKRPELPTPTIYLADETAWLDLTAQLVAEGRWDEIDRDNLSEYLTDMARRDRREVVSRLAVLLAHLLKWEHQPDQRTGSWQATIAHQQFELRHLLESGTLKNHAVEVLGDAYEQAISQAGLETGLPVATFPEACPYTIDTVLGEE